MKGKFVLVPFPFTDLTVSKLRPALVIHQGERDLVVAFISSRIPQDVSDSEIVIRLSHSEFRLSGLKVDSVVVLRMTAVPIPLNED
ncbi:MAG: type II toxin-antitoxin system PemK/MazF family toxin [Candidatus Thorarchaeota archaeon]